jgi:peptidoglycan/LPS O-acetylase OafA/YrhL
MTDDNQNSFGKGASNRLHALDNLRAIMMWLGIVFHVAIIHIVGASPLPWHDLVTSPLADFLVAFLHCFRMPVFFILSGFFVAYLSISRGYGGMLKHRLRRLGLPFVVFLPLVLLAISPLITQYLSLMASEDFSASASIAQPDFDRPLIPTMHLWFTYYLMWFCGFAALFGLAKNQVPDRLKALVSKGWGTLTSSWWGFLVLSLPLAAAGSFYSNGIVTPDASFVPRVTEFVYGGMFFMFGWVLYRRQEILLAFYARQWRRHALAGLGFFLLAGALFDIAAKKPGQIAHLNVWIAFIYNSASWLWSFALIGFFMRYVSAQNRFLTYLAESSYRVYIVHLPLTVGFGILLWDTQFGAPARIAINVLATTFVCILSYQTMVRFTPLSALLNGRHFESRIRWRTVMITVAVALAGLLAFSQIKFSQGGISALMLASGSVAALHSSGRRFAAVAAVYPLCFLPWNFDPHDTAHIRTDLDFLRPDADRPLLVLMGDEDTLAPAYDCVPHLKEMKEQGMSVEWRLFEHAGHGWDVIESDRKPMFSFRGPSMPFKYDPAATTESRRLLLDFLARRMPGSGRS